MEKAKIIVYGSPSTWSRVKRGKFGERYNDPKMIVYQNRISDSFFSLLPKWKPVDQPVFIEALAFFPIPNTMPKYLKAIAETEELPYHHAPDADNLMKNVCDALQGIAFGNDSRVTDILLRKRYSPRPRMEINIHFPEPLSQKKKVVDECQFSLFKE